jgi:DNA-binding transcriptional LysR family regulator
VVAGSHHPQARRHRVRLGDLTEQAWVLPPANTLISTLVTDAFLRSGLSAPRVSVVAPPLLLRLIFASRGRLLTAVPAIVLRGTAKEMSIKRVPVELPANRRPVGLVTLKDRVLSPVAQLFVEHTRTVARTMAKG